MVSSSSWRVGRRLVQTARRFPPASSGPRTAARVRARRPVPRDFAVHGTRHRACLSSFLACPDDAERGAEPFPLSLRHSDGRPSPTCLQASSPVTGGRAASGALTFTKPYRGVLAP